MIISTTSPDLLFDCDLGELVEKCANYFTYWTSLPDDVYFIYYPGPKDPN